MKLSVITVNYNNPEGLERTIISVKDQICKDFEYIVVDGASTKGDIDIIRKYEEVISKWVSEPDTGIYNAMNKAVNMAIGDYCLFLNSGDTLFQKTTVEEIYAISFSEDFVEGRIKQGSYVSTAPERYTLGSYIWKRNNFHQASLIKRNLLIEYPYNETNKIASDMRFNVEAIVVHNCTYRGIDVLISNYEAGGRSTRINHDNEVKAIFSDFFPTRVMEDYYDHYYLYDFPAKYLMPIVRWIGHSYCLYYLKIVLKQLMGRSVEDREYIELAKRRKNERKKN